MQSILLGGGCFWCTESVFLQLRGVSRVVSGYAGGAAETANYEAVCTGKTGHVEVVKVVFDKHIIDLPTILSVFFATHDPTQLNRQGNDMGAQYASAIFYTDAAQKKVAEHLIGDFKSQGIPVVTRTEPAPMFYPAEDYHQNFFARNPTQGYCCAVIPPKLAKLQQGFSELLK